MTSGAQPSSQTYYPYGAVRSGTLPTDYTFTGQKRDNDAGLHFYNARYYDSGLGRFTQPDTIVPDPFNPQDLNRYTYTRNNPVRYTDPSGHACLPCLIIGAAAVVVGIIDFLASPDIVYAPAANVDVSTLPPSDLPDNDMALCSFCSYAERGAWGAAIVAGVIETTPVDEIPGANKAVGKVLDDVPNPFGKNGGPGHQGAIDDIIDEIVGRKNDWKREYQVPTPGGHKGKRFVDVAELDPDTGVPINFNQVGKVNKDGVTPVMRERRAINDISESPDGMNIPITFHPYNIIEY